MEYARHNTRHDWAKLLRTLISYGRHLLSYMGCLLVSRYVTVSAKVRRELLEEARRLNINVSELIRRALEEEVRRRKLLRLEERLKEKQDILAKIDVEELVRLIREDRDTR